MKYLLLLILLLIIIFFLFIRLPKTDVAPETSTPTQEPMLASDNFSKKIFAQELGTPRVLQFSPEGTLLVSVPSQDKVYALPDKNKDGVADGKKEIISGVSEAHGLAFYKDKLYVAGVTEVSRYNWNEEKLEATLDKKLFSLPTNSNHNKRSIVFDDKGNLYISLGSTCNVCNEEPEKGGSVLISNSEGASPRVFARGLRNSPFLKINPTTGELWGTEMGRDLLGDNLPPDEVNIIKEGKNYGWPNCYSDKTPDKNFNPKATDETCQDTQVPIFKIPAHNAPLGLIFIDSPKFPTSWQGDLLVALHGSWNSSVPVGYKVIHLSVEGNSITESEDFLIGGRPVDLTFDKNGTLYLSDDRDGIVYIIDK